MNRNFVAVKPDLKMSELIKDYFNIYWKSAFKPEYSILKKLNIVIMNNRGIVFLYGFFRIIYYYYYA